MTLNAVFCYIACDVSITLAEQTSTIHENFPLFCPKCKQETLISAKDLNVAVIPQQIAESAGAVNGQDERRINAPPLTALPVSADG